MCADECGSTEEPQLTRFKGRPGELSPKARFWLFAGWLLPSRFKYVFFFFFSFALSARDSNDAAAPSLPLTDTTGL